LCASSPLKWIEECLPQEYKRKYAKSEPSSLSRNAKKLGKILVDNEGKSLAESSSYDDSNLTILLILLASRSKEEIEIRPYKKIHQII
jgi:hypothetical protein